MASKKLKTDTGMSCVKDSLDDLRAAHMKAGKSISKHLAKATACIADAVMIAEEYGVPFAWGDCPGGWQTYVPKSMEQKFGSLVEKGSDDLNELLYDLAGISAYGLEDNYGYWMNSSSTC